MRDDRARLCGCNSLPMDKLKDILWPIILHGGSGAFIDFDRAELVKREQKDFLLRWRVQFNDLRCTQRDI
jgi:hypothetical protein